MVTLEETLEQISEWTVDRLHILCDKEADELLEVIEDAHALRLEFAEWLDPNIEDHEIFSLEYLGEDD